MKREARFDKGLGLTKGSQVMMGILSLVRNMGCDWSLVQQCVAEGFPVQLRSALSYVILPIPPLQVRVWRLGPDSQTMEASMKEHKATVNAICLRASDQQCVTASDDGSCIVWDLQRFVRSNIMYSQTYFKAVAYFQDESQILTTGSDRKVCHYTKPTLCE